MVLPFRYRLSLVAAAILFCATTEVAVAFPYNSTTTSSPESPITYVNAFPQFELTSDTASSPNNIGMAFGKDSQDGTLNFYVGDLAAGRRTPVFKLSVDQHGNCVVAAPFNEMFTDVNCWTELKQGGHHVAAASAVIPPNINLLLKAVDQLAAQAGAP